LSKPEIKASTFLRALVAILVADARGKGAMGDLYLGSIKLPDDGFRFRQLEETSEKAL